MRLVKMYRDTQKEQAVYVNPEFIVCVYPPKMNKTTEFWFEIWMVRLFSIKEGMDTYYYFFGNEDEMLTALTGSVANDPRNRRWGV